MVMKTVRINEKDLICILCGDTLFSKNECGKCPSKDDPYLWYSDEILVCDSCGYITTAFSLACK